MNFVKLPMKIATFNCNFSISIHTAGTEVKGDIQCMHRTIGPFMHRLSGFVHQDDLFDGMLTVLEHLTFVVRMNDMNQHDL